MSKDRFAPKSLSDVVDNMPNGLKNFAQKTSQNQVLERLLAEVLDKNMMSKCEIAHYENGTLVLNAQSAAVAMRLNYMKMNILSGLRQNGLPGLGQIKINTSPRNAKLKPQKAVNQDPRHKVLSKQAKQSLLEVAEHAPESLKVRLERLAKLADRDT